MPEPTKRNYRRSESTKALRDVIQLPHLLDENIKELRGEGHPQRYKFIKVCKASRLRPDLPDEAGSSTPGFATEQLCDLWASISSPIQWGKF